MAEAKTRPTGAAVDDFLAAVAPAARRGDSLALRDLMADVSGAAPAMWGPSIVGFGSHHYRYASGREGDTCRIGFSPRKSATVLYVADDLTPLGALLDRLGPHERGAGCVYIKRLDAVDAGVLRELVQAGWDNRA